MIKSYKVKAVIYGIIYIILVLVVSTSCSNRNSEIVKKSNSGDMAYADNTFNNEAITKTPTFETGEDPRPSGSIWERVDNMTDEFEGSSLDTSKWQDEPVGNDWVWIGRPPGLFKASNVRVDDGKMQVTVSKLDAPQIINGSTYTHQGAIVRSKYPGQLGWYFECKMKANKTVMSSTFWLMSKWDCEKKLELDIQECVGRTTDKTEEWGKNWDEIYHSNAIHRTTTCHPEPERDQAHVKTNVKNHERFFIYGAWWKSTTEVMFFLDGKYVYSLNPTVEWDMPGYIQMAIETYDWNPIPEDGGIFETATEEERTTQYEWVRTWKLKQ